MTRFSASKLADSIMRAYRNMGIKCGVFHDEEESAFFVCAEDVMLDRVEYN